MTSCARASDFLYSPGNRPDKVDPKKWAEKRTYGTTNTVTAEEGNGVFKHPKDCTENQDLGMVVSFYCETHDRNKGNQLGQHSTAVG